MALPHEERPMGLQVPPVRPGVEIPPEPPDVGARALAVSARLLGPATPLFFLPFLFSYFHLRPVEVQHIWRPPQIQPHPPLRAAVAGCVVLSRAPAGLAPRA